MIHWLDVNNIAFEIFAYPISYVELIGTLFGFLSVYLASKANIWTWPSGIINEIAFFSLFYQVQLYSDMYLQLYFFIVTLYGWYYWKKTSKEKEKGVSSLSKKSILVYAVVLVLGVIVSGAWISNIHLYFPDLFPEPAAYPFADAFTTVASILAMLLLSRKKIETWFLWIAVDCVAIVIYFLKGIHLVMIEYVVFLIICIFGYFNWKRKL